MPPLWTKATTRYQRLFEPGEDGKPAPALFGAGAFGSVTIAVDTFSHRTVAIKSQGIPSEQATRELLALSHLRHFPSPFVITLLDMYVEGPRLRLVFDALETSLHGYFKTTLVRSGRLEKPAVIRMLSCVVRGLGHLHDLSIVHGDITAKNILIGDGRRCVIADLGAAHEEGDPSGDLGDKTTYYVRAPEFWLPPVTPRASVDMWALGVVAQGLISGEIAFFGRRLKEKPVDDDWIGEHGLNVFHAVLGPPPPDSLAGLKALPAWPREPPAPEPLLKGGRDANDGLLAFPSTCLCWLPAERATASALWQSHWFDEELPQLFQCFAGMVGRVIVVIPVCHRICFQHA